MSELEKLLIGTLTTMVGIGAGLLKYIQRMYEKQLKERDAQIAKLDAEIQELREERDQFLQTLVEIRRVNGS